MDNVIHMHFETVVMMLETVRIKRGNRVRDKPPQGPPSEPQMARTGNLRKETRRGRTPVSQCWLRNVTVLAVLAKGFARVCVHVCVDRQYYGAFALFCVGIVQCPAVVALL